MKNNYEARATRFIESTLVKLFDGCTDFYDFKYALKHYNANHKRTLNWAHGVSRIAIIRNDYVVKVDYRPTGRWANGRAGNCESELEVYMQAVADGMEHLLAKTTVLHMNGLTFSIMPRINGIDDWSRDWTDHCTIEERIWLNDHVHDLHDGNVGYRRNKVCVVDYAWEV